MIEKFFGDSKYVYMVIIVICNIDVIFKVWCYIVWEVKLVRVLVVRFEIVEEIFFGVEYVYIMFGGIIYEDFFFIGNVNVLWFFKDYWYFWFVFEFF